MMRSPRRVIRIPPATRSYHYWHEFVPGLRPGQLYGYRVAGPLGAGAPGCGSGCREAARPLRASGGLSRVGYDRRAAIEPGDNTGHGDGKASSSIHKPMIGKATCRWRIRPRDTIIYEMHVRGFTRHPSFGVSQATCGTYAGADRENPISPASRHYRGRAAARPSSSTPSIVRPGTSTTGATPRSRSLRPTRPTRARGLEPLGRDRRVSAHMRSKPSNGQASK